MRGRFALFCALVVLPLIAGCESGTQGAATPSSVSPEALFDSCTLPDEAIRAAGADPESRDDNPFGVPRTGWRGCLWVGDRWAMRVFATTEPANSFRANSYFREFRSVDLNGRVATSFIQGDENPPGNCTIFFPSRQGTIEVYISKDVDLPALNDPCGLTLRATRALDPWLPKD
ncbi:DUF3558 family protein [Nocardia jiangsuensis]|uniref:DUF3558 family protein n=1 Tax=Nocardia jiangsuensis TaxID=1691563 RepID=A0ABV8DVF6_9NOCA